MEKKVIMTAILITLLSVVFSMSGDGGNVPVEKKEANQQLVQGSTAITNQAEQVKSNETVKDRLSVDTGMTNEEFEQFKQNYALKFKQIFPNFTENAMDWFFDYKINLNAIDKFEENGLNLKEFSIAQGSSFQKNALFCDIIVTGKITEMIQKDEATAPRYKLKVNQIIHGSEEIKKYLGEIPEFLYVVALLGTSIDNESMLNKGGIYFLQIDSEVIKHSLFVKRYYSTVLVYNDSNVCYERDFYKFDSAFKYKNGKLELSKMQKDNNYEERYLKWYKECQIGSWDEVVKSIRTILEINEGNYFYKRNYSTKGE
jgi:hypothetical protein